MPNEKQPVNPSEGHEQSNVEVTLDGVPKILHRGSISVSELKSLWGVADADKLVVVEDGKLVPLGDKVVIKPGLTFRTVKGSGGSA